MSLSTMPMRARLKQRRMVVTSTALPMIFPALAAWRSAGCDARIVQAVGIGRGERSTGGTRDAGPWRMARARVLLILIESLGIPESAVI